MEKEIKISKEDAANISEEYKEIFETETNHKHPVVSVSNIYRWKANPRVQKIVGEMGLNNTIELFEHLGLGKNSEERRKLYRDLGYSLAGYWEVFYWEANNEDAAIYKRP